jgi:hypothetical protein
MEEEQEKLVSRHQDLVTKDETIVHLLTSICYSSLRRLGAILIITNSPLNAVTELY